MNFLIRAGSNDPEFHEGDEYFQVDITKEKAQEIMRRRKTFLSIRTEDDSLWEMGYWDGDPQCITGTSLFDGPTPKLDDEQRALFEDNNFTELSDDFTVEDESIVRTECDQMVIRENGVLWTCYLKYVEGVTLISETIPFDLIEGLL